MESQDSVRTSRKARGNCSKCGSVRKLHDSDGKVHLHGHRADPCKGSHKLPRNATRMSSADEENDTTRIGDPTDTSPPRPPTNLGLISSEAVGPVERDDQTIAHPTLPFRLMKHIPKAARPCTGRLLSTLINGILKEADKPSRWQALLTFGASILEQPIRGGRRHNLTSTVKKRVESFPTEWTRKWYEICSANPAAEKARSRLKMSEDQAVAAAVASKLEDGNIRAAVRILCSSDKPAREDKNAMEELLSKHPVPPSDRPRIPTNPSASPLQLTEEQILGQIRSFPTGSSAGPDGLRPQHLLELIRCPETGPELITSITGLVNLILAGTCPERIRPLLFGGMLIALRKKTGGLRPIVIGYYWRRLTSKSANAYAAPRAAINLSPRQVGIGVPGGGEATVHAARRFVGSMSADCVLAKLDFKNAFNSLHRDRMLAAQDKMFPELTP